MFVAFWLHKLKDPLNTSDKTIAEAAQGVRGSRKPGSQIPLGHGGTRCKVARQGFSIQKVQIPRVGGLSLMVSAKVKFTTVGRPLH